MKMVGLAKLQQGLYHLITQENSSLTSYVPYGNNLYVSPIKTNKIWHFRFGHLSNTKLNILHDQYLFIPKHVHGPCDICHLAKQKQLSYSVSTNRA